MSIVALSHYMSPILMRFGHEDIGLLQRGAPPIAPPCHQQPRFSTRGIKRIKGGQQLAEQSKHRSASKTRKMVKTAKTQADAFDVTTRSVGCAALFFPRAKAFTAWWNRITNRKNYKDISNKLASAHTSVAPEEPVAILDEAQLSFSRVQSDASSSTEPVQTPTMTADDAWGVMRNRFVSAHDVTTRASSDGNNNAPAARRNRRASLQ